MISYFIELNEYKPQNRKCAEMAEFANQFGNTLCPDKISFDAFKTELEAKVKELNEKYPKTMPLKISSGSGFIHIDQDTKTHNNGCDKLEESPVLSPEFTQERRFPRIKG